MAHILNIETSTKNCSISIARDGKTLHCKEIAEQGYSHAEKLHVFISEVLKELQLEFSDLTAIAVSQGPGSYTGLRIGVSAAKGLCYALDIPLIAVDTMKILASAISIESGVVIPMIDARRMEVYSAVFDSKGNKTRDTKAEIINGESFQEINQSIHFIGDGALKCQEILNSDKFVYHPEVIYPSAKQMSLLSFEKYKKSDTVDVAYFEPFYLKDFLIQKKL
jgi:tRNA threonylcarbamoyladenosine biosynthesis protein TsaB